MARHRSKDVTRYRQGTINFIVTRGNMEMWSIFYETHFNFREIRYFDIEGKLTGLRSRAMISPCDRIRIPINESADDKSQMEEYLKDHNGEGIQHIALGTDDIYATVAALRAKHLKFMDTPATYYDMLDDRVSDHGEDLDQLRDLRIWLDGAPSQGQGLWLQIFSDTVIGPLFFEIIQRQGNDGLGEGNFKAQFGSIELDQLRRGVLTDASSLPRTLCVIGFSPDVAAAICYDTHLKPRYTIREDHMAHAHRDSAFDTIQIEREDAIEWLTLNRPERLNALSRQMCADLQAYFEGLYTDPSVRIVIMRGAGRGFCAGYDLRDADDFSAGTAVALRAQRHVSEIILRMRRCPQPIIGLIDGAAAGGGFALALAADVRYATPQTRMNVAMAKVGMTGCDMGISYFLPKTVGVSVAAELMMSGRFIEAERALSLGLVSDVVEPDALNATGLQLAQDMLSLSPLGLRLTKEGLNMALSAGSLEQAITLEDRGQILCATAGLFNEGLSAFLEKRDPIYSND